MLSFTMAGSISVDLQTFTHYLAATFSAMFRAGLGPLVVVSAHGGNDVPCIAAMEQVFHQHPAALLYCNVLGHHFIDLVTEVWGTPDLNLAENCSLWAAWEMQGHSSCERPLAPPDQEGKPQHLRRIGLAGYVPHTYARPGQHIVIRDEGTVTQGREFLARTAGRIVSVLPDLCAYHDELAGR